VTTLEGTTVGVVGAGAMGSGIAQVAAAAGHRVVLGDLIAGATEKARASIAKALDRAVEKKKMSRADADALLARIDFHPKPLAHDVTIYRSCGLVIEAIVETIGAKRRLFEGLESVVLPDAVLATNTSSLSVTAIAGACWRGQRVIGLHFFNPAPVLPLVEVVPWAGTQSAVVSAARGLMSAWGKTSVLASDTPGFIVNRIARPYYGESIRIAEEGIADYATIDAAMRELGKFRMGPFELMDFIGNDVNLAVTRAVFEGFFYDPRYRPSLTQQRLVEAGLLGRKTGRGYYDYADGAVKPEAKSDPVVALLVFERVIAMLINEAVDAVHLDVASPADIDLAMTRGANYPKGLLAWCDEIGADRVLSWMTSLHEEFAEDRYRPSPLLRRMARQKTRFFA
jgi:3-hydroxybutyryl-CoA dehydrogenase